MQSECRSRREIDVRRRGVVENDAEDLANLCGSHWCALRFIQPVLSLRSLPGIADVDNTADDALEVDRRLAARGVDAGKTGDVGLARLNRLDRLLRVGPPAC